MPFNVTEMRILPFSPIPIFLLFVKIDSAFVFPCKTPNNESGACISIFECPILRKMLGNLESSASTTVVKSSVCRNWAFKDLMVCCPESIQHAENQTTTAPTLTTSTSETRQDEEESRKQYALEKLIPPRRICGYQHTDDRFYDKPETALDEFPWLVHITYGHTLNGKVVGPLSESLDFYFRCSGVLINNRYVLTKDICFSNAYKIRLGEYNTKRNTTCIEDSHLEECTESTIEIEIEERFLSEDDNNAPNGFAMFRLAKGVTYSDFIRPICLPIRKPGEPDNFETLIVSGWGAEDDSEVNKKKIYYNVTLNKEECYSKDYLDESDDTSDLICVQPLENNTYLPCYGDQGGPLMYSYRHQWFVDALIGVTVADNSCSADGSASASRITPDVIDWILKNIHK